MGGEKAVCEQVSDNIIPLEGGIEYLIGSVCNLIGWYKFSVFRSRLCDCSRCCHPTVASNNEYVESLIDWRLYELAAVVGNDCY